MTTGEGRRTLRLRLRNRLPYMLIATLPYMLIVTLLPIVLVPRLVASEPVGWGNVARASGFANDRPVGQNAAS